MGSTFLVGGAIFEGDGNVNIENENVRLSPPLEIEWDFFRNMMCLNYHERNEMRNY